MRTAQRRTLRNAPLADIRQQGCWVKNKNKIILVGVQVETSRACCEPVGPLDGGEYRIGLLLNRGPANLRTVKTAGVKIQGVMTLLRVWERQVRVRYLCHHSRPVRIACISVDTQTLCIISMG